MTTIEEAKGVAEQLAKRAGLSLRDVKPPEWAYEAAYEINNALELGCEAADLNWMARKIWRKSRKRTSD